MPHSCSEPAREAQHVFAVLQMCHERLEIAIEAHLTAFRQRKQIVPAGARWVPPQSCPCLNRTAHCECPRTQQRQPRAAFTDVAAINMQQELALSDSNHTVRSERAAAPNQVSIGIDLQRNRSKK